MSEFERIDGDIAGDAVRSLTGFLDSRKVEQSEALTKIQKEALLNEVPIIRPATQRLIAFLLELTKPAAILEVGTATGFSSLYMHETKRDAKIVTIERDERRAAEAAANIAALGEGQITLLTGDAAEILPTLEGPFDFVFMDAGKGQYIHFLPEIRRVLRPGGILLSDNIFKEGEILKSRYFVTRRNRTIHSRMREYLDTLLNDPAFTTVLLESGDGASISLKKEAQ